MTNIREDLKFRCSLKDTVLQSGLEWRSRQNVYPFDEKYSTIFMNAQRKELFWIYQGDIPSESQIICEGGINWCVRSDSFEMAGKSNRHLSSFEMLGINGIMREDDAIEKTVRLLTLDTGIHPEQIFTNLSGDNKLAISTLLDLGISIRNKPLDFSRIDTNRSGHRLEFNISFESKNGINQEWEVQNMVVLTNIGGIQIRKPIIDSGGSFERLIAIKEGVEDIFESSILKPSVDYVKQFFSKKNIFEKKIAESFVDLTRTAIIMSESGFIIGTKTRQEQTFRKLAREIGIRLIKYEINLSDYLNIISFIKKEKNIFNDYSDKYQEDLNYLEKSGFILMIENMLSTYGKIYEKLLDGKNNGLDLNELTKKFSKKYDGASDNGIAKLAFDRISVY